MATLAAALLTAGAAAGTADADGKMGDKLVWLPYRPVAPSAARPAAPANRPAIAPTDYQQPAEAKPAAPGLMEPPSVAPPPTEAMLDPFGDREKKAEKQGSAPRDPAGGPPVAPVLSPAAQGQPAAELSPKRLSTVPIEEPVKTEEPAKTSSGGPASDVAPRAAEPPTVPRSFPSLPPLGPSAPSNRDLAPLAEGSVTATSPPLEEACPPAGDFKPISELSHRTEPKSGTFPRECDLKAEPFQPRAWSQTTFAWKASGLCHKPAYFEDVQLERYGHSWGPYLQPVISHAHFFVTVPALPYLMGLNPPNECIYTLGYYRAGSCAPYMLDPLPLSVRAGLWEAGAWTGAAFLVP